MNKYLKFQDGWSQKNIAMDLKTSRHGVEKILTKFEKHATPENIKKSGRPRRNDNRSKRILIRDARCHPKKTARELQFDWRTSQPTLLSTVKNILRKYGLLGRISARKPFLNERHVRSHLGWCKAYSKVEPSFWKDVIFSD